MSANVLTQNATVAIAGGGLLGRLLAWRLLLAGHRVTLYEAGTLQVSPSAAHTAAGMISPVSEAVDTEPLMYRLGLVALQQWPLWLQELGRALPSEPIVQYQHNGSLIVAHHRDQALLNQYAHDLQQQLPEQAQAQLLDRAALAHVEPDISHDFQQGLLLAQEAHIDNRQLLNVLLTHIQYLGGECIENSPVDVEPYVVHTLSDKQQRRFDCVLDCRGVGAKPQWQKVRGVRGEILRVQTDEVQLQRPVRLLHPRYQLYIVPKLNNQFVIGATQIESEDSSPVSVQSALELNSALYTVNPAFSEARIVEMQANLRPALNDNRPQIQCGDGLMKINGLYRHGYLLAPVVVQYTLARLLAGVNTNGDFDAVLYHSMGIDDVVQAEGVHSA